jgi:hypothetical protein
MRPNSQATYSGVQPSACSATDTTYVTARSFTFPAHTATLLIPYHSKDTFGGQKITAASDTQPPHIIIHHPHTHPHTHTNTHTGNNRGLTNNPMATHRSLVHYCTCPQQCSYNLHVAIITGSQQWAVTIMILLMHTKCPTHTSPHAATLDIHAS